MDDLNIKCPHCGYKHYDYGNYVDITDLEGEFIMLCEDCGEEFKVHFQTKITFKCKANS